MTTTSIAQLSRTRTSACCTSCDWNAREDLVDLAVRVSARQHTATTHHPVAVLTSTLTTLVDSSPAAPPNRIGAS